MYKNITRIVTIVGLILVIPLIGNLTVDGWNWGVLDFVFMGSLLFGTGLLIDFAIRKIPNPVYKVLAVFSIIITLLVVWVEMAVDGVSQILKAIF